MTTKTEQLDALASHYGTPNYSELLAVVNRLANPDSGELLTLDDYRQIARNVVAKHTQAAREPWEKLGELEGRPVYIDSVIYYKDWGTQADPYAVAPSHTSPEIMANLTWEKPEVLKLSGDMREIKPESSLHFVPGV